MTNQGALSHLFTTPVWNIKGISQQLVDELYQGAYRFKKMHPSPSKIRSNDGGYQTPFLEWKDFHPEGQKYIEKIINDHVGSYTGDEVKVDEWWYNINPKGAWNVPHNHVGSTADFALVLYLTDTDNLLTLLNPFPARKEKYNNVEIIPRTQKGDIIIFPCDILHYVSPNKRDTDRVSISMNLQLC